MINGEQVRKLIENAALRAAESGVAITVEYIDKSLVYDGDGDLSENRDIEIRIRATPPNDETTTVEIQGGPPPYG